MKLTRKIREQADEIHTIKSLDEIPLKNLARRIAEAVIKQYGFYTYTRYEDGKKHLIVMEVR